jgi:hypothetical protein
MHASVILLTAPSAISFQSEENDAPESEREANKISSHVYKGLWEECPSRNTYVYPAIVQPFASRKLRMSPISSRI